jgi:hypothetical protein
MVFHRWDHVVPFSGRGEAKAARWLSRRLCDQDFFFQVGAAGLLSCEKSCR